MAENAMKGLQERPSDAKHKPAMTFIHIVALKAKALRWEGGTEASADGNPYCRIGEVAYRITAFLVLR